MGNATFRLRFPLFPNIHGDTLVGEALKSARANTYQAKTVVEDIWSSSDSILLVSFAAIPYFTLARSADWLVFGDGFLSDVTQRMIQTARYVQRYVFATPEQQQKIAGKIRKIHTVLEEKRGETILNMDYRGVLFILIDTGEQAYNLLHGPMSDQQKQEQFEFWMNLGRQMGIADLPNDYASYQVIANSELNSTNFYKSEISDQLFKSYKSQAGSFRYFFVEQIMSMTSHPYISELTGLKTHWLTQHFIKLYTKFRSPFTIWLNTLLIAPRRYRKQIYGLNVWDKQKSIAIHEEKMRIKRCPFHFK